MNVLLMILWLLFYLALPVAIVVGIVALVRRGRIVRTEIEELEGGASAPVAARSGRLAVEWERLFLYILSFAGLMTVLFAVYGLLALAVGLLIHHVTTLGTLISDQDAKTRVSYYLHSTICL
jgi:hypothetical protein